MMFFIHHHATNRKCTPGTFFYHTEDNSRKGSCNYSLQCVSSIVNTAHDMQQHDAKKRNNKKIEVSHKKSSVNNGSPEQPQMLQTKNQEDCQGNEQQPSTRDRNEKLKMTHQAVGRIYTTQLDCKLPAIKGFNVLKSVEIDA